MTQRPTNENLLKSLIVSLAVCVPAFCLFAYVLETRSVLAPPGVVVPVMLGMTAVDFVLIVGLEYYRSQLGALTLPALLAAMGVVLALVVMDGINHFVMDFGYAWLMPVVVAYMAFSTAAVFKERRVPVKCLLSLNAVMLTTLCALGTTGKIPLPF